MESALTGKKGNSYDDANWLVSADGFTVPAGYHYNGLGDRLREMVNGMGARQQISR